MLHKVPVIDQPSVITVDSKQEDAFAKTDGKSDMTKIGAVLNDAKEIIENHLAKEEIAYAILRFLSTSLVFSSHFAEDELYNYITDSFHPDNTLSELFHEIVGKITQMDHSSSIVSHLHKGMVELQEQDSWIYFKFPSYLKQIQAIDKMVKIKKELKINIMQKLKQVILRKIESKFKDSKYVADIVKINDKTGCGGLHGYTDINDPALDEYRDWINFHIRMMESMNASKMTLTVGENVEL